LRAIRESIDLPLVRNIPRFPREVAWFAATGIAVKGAVMEIWKREDDPGRAELCANIALTIGPKPEDWVDQWEQGPPPRWVDAVNRIKISSLALPVELANDETTLAAYHGWLDRNLLSPMKSESPAEYEAVVDQVRGFILNISESGNDDGPESLRS
jgi:hypothetical protein